MLILPQGRCIVGGGGRIGSLGARIGSCLQIHLGRQCVTLISVGVSSSGSIPHRQINQFKETKK